jgi:hypothetical protein
MEELYRRFGGRVFGSTATVVNDKLHFEMSEQLQVLLLLKEKQT